MKWEAKQIYNKLDNEMGGKTILLVKILCVMTTQKTGEGNSSTRMDSLGFHLHHNASDKNKDRSVNSDDQ